MNQNFTLHEVPHLNHFTCHGQNMAVATLHENCAVIAFADARF